MNYFVANMAVETITGAAVAVMELQQCLCVGGMRGLDACRAIEPDDAVVLGRELLEEVDGAILERLLGMLAAVEEEQRHPGVDDETLSELGTGVLGFAGRRAVETVVVVPIRGGREGEELTKAVGGGGLEETAEKACRTADELRKLTDADGGEAVGTHAGETPQMGRHRTQARGIADGLIVGLQLARVVIIEIAFKQARLPHKERLFALRLVAPAGKNGVGRGEGQQLERERIGCAAEIMGKGEEEALLPVAATALEQTLHVGTLVFETVEKETVETGGDIVGRELFELGRTGHRDGLGRMDEGFVVVPQGLRDVVVKREGGQRMAVVKGERGVVLIDDMKDDVVVGAVETVVVAVPIGGEDMHLDVACPQGAANPHAGVGEVGTSIAVEQTRTLDDDRLPVDGAEVAFQQPMLPYVLEEGFVHARHCGQACRVNDEVYINAAPDSEGAAKGVLVEEVFHLVEESALGL